MRPAAISRSAASASRRARSSVRLTTHWSFGQLAGLVGAPAAYLRQLPAALAGINLQYGLTSHRAEQVKTLETDDGRLELRAVTGPDYGRIYDHELVAAVQRIAGNGTGDTRWKVPGVLDWSTGVYNPRVDVTQDTTTLYASDRDVFLFLVDDLNPIEAGRLPDGSPDLYFRGFYCWNSEVGAKTLGMASLGRSSATSRRTRRSSSLRAAASCSAASPARASGPRRACDAHRGISLGPEQARGRTARSGRESVSRAARAFGNRSGKRSLLPWTHRRTSRLGRRPCTACRSA